MSVKYLVIIITLAIVHLANALDLTTRSGQLYSASHVLDVTSAGIVIISSNKKIIISFKDLTDTEQMVFSYDAKRARRDPIGASDEAVKAWRNKIAKINSQEKKEIDIAQSRASDLVQASTTAAANAADLAQARAQAQRIAWGEAQVQAQARAQELAREEEKRLRDNQIRMAPHSPSTPPHEVNQGATSALTIMLVIIILLVVLHSASASKMTENAREPEQPQVGTSRRTRNSQQGTSETETHHEQAKPNDAPMPQVKDERYYGMVLGLQGKLTKTELKKSYRELIAKYHPDKVQHLGKEFQMIAEAKTKEIIEAYEFMRSRYRI